MADLDFASLIQAVEDAAPFDVATAVGDHIRAAFGGAEVTFWIADYSGYSLERLDHALARESVSVASSTAGRALRTQRVESEPSESGVRLFVPVTARGEAVGVLEVTLNVDPTPDQRRHLKGLGHAFAYVIAGTRRHTDLFEWGQRSRTLNVAAEIQRRLLPAFTCECPSLTLAGWVEPAYEAGGDTFDYTTEPAGMSVMLTDAMGHGISAALLATLTLGVLRNERRRSASVADQANAANRLLFDRTNEEEFVTGVLVEIPTSGAPASLVSAGHPVPWRLRGGKAEPLSVEQAPPLGMFGTSRYEARTIDFLPGDRLILVSDGIVETLDQVGPSLEALVVQSRELHPREVVQLLTSTVTALQDGALRDDATAVCIEWSRADRDRQSSAGADVQTASSRLTGSEARPA
jgi:serine phosphatase RsbU (regulator of sigma subunit)